MHVKFASHWKVLIYIMCMLFTCMAKATVCVLPGLVGHQRYLKYMSQYIPENASLSIPQNYLLW